MTTFVSNPMPTKILGWREWVALPDLGLPAIKAKVDTGAKTSALHAFQIKRFNKHGKDWVNFLIHPLQYDLSLVVECEAILIDRRKVTDSGGHREYRYVIETSLSISYASDKVTDKKLNGRKRKYQDKEDYPIEVTLTEREDMRFRMLLGRQGIPKKMLVDASASYLTKRLNAKRLYGLTS